MHSPAGPLPAGPLAPLPPALRLYLYLTLALLALALLCELVSRFVLHLGAPFDSPLVHEYFPDVVDMRARYQYFHTLQFFTDSTDAPCMYPAATAVVYRFLYLFRPYDLAVALAFAAGSCVAAAILFGRELRRRGLPLASVVPFLGIVVLTSFPLWVELKQANVEIVAWVLLTAGVWCFLRGRGFSAAACFGIAGAMKLYPFVYLGLFLARRRFRELAVAAFAAVAVALPSQWLVYPHLRQSWQLSSQKIASYREAIVLQRFAQTALDHSLFGGIKAGFGHLLPSTSVLSTMLTVYLPLAAIAAALLWWLRIRHLPVTNQVLCLAIFTVLLPPTSFDYTLLHLYIPWALLVLLALAPTPGTGSPRVPGLTPALVCLAILFAPETELIYQVHSFGGQVKALTLIALLLLGLIHPFPQAKHATAIEPAGPSGSLRPAASSPSPLDSPSPTPACPATVRSAIPTPAAPTAPPACHRSP